LNKYLSLSPIQRSALRVVQHKNVIFSLAKEKKERFYIQDFIDLVNNPLGSANAIFSFLGVDAMNSLKSKANLTVLDKWRSQLGDENLKDIAKIESEYAQYPVSTKFKFESRI